MGTAPDWAKYIPAAAEKPNDDQKGRRRMEGCVECGNKYHCYNEDMNNTVYAKKTEDGKDCPLDRVNKWGERVTSCLCPESCRMCYMADPCDFVGIDCRDT